MSFLRCCIGGDSRPPPEQIRPVGASAQPSRRGHARPPPIPQSGHTPAQDVSSKLKLPNEVFFDPTKPDGQLSSVTDPPNSARDFSEMNKKKDPKERSRPGRQHRETRKDATADDKADLNAPDNNGLTRGQNFMKVEKWLRNASMYQQIDITPGPITNIEDTPPQISDAADPPSEKDRLPPQSKSKEHQHHKTAVR